MTTHVKVPTIPSLVSTEFAKSLSPATLDRDMALFQFLADNTSELRTANGCRINDATDVCQWFREVAGTLATRERRKGA